VYGLFVSVVPASLTRNEFPQLRLVAFPVFFLILTIPATRWLLELRGQGGYRRAVTYSAYSVIIGITLYQALVFQYRYHRNAPSLWYVFDARFDRKILTPALAAERRPIYLVDPPGKSGYIQALWHGLLRGVSPDDFRRVSSDGVPPPGSVVISTAEDCDHCSMIARSLNYIAYAVPPYSSFRIEKRGPLADFSAVIVAEDEPSRLKPAEHATIRLLIRNTSRSVWPAIGNPAGDREVVMQARWRDKSGKLLPENEFGKRLPYDIEPGDTVGLTCEVAAPKVTGEYLLEFDLKEEPANWFAEHASKSVLLRVQVDDEGQ
ncbi:MAG: hypothetical protein ACJ8M4_03635, partial [Chthoniobacterales bacterium]